MVYILHVSKTFEEGGDMAEIRKDDLLIKGSGWTEEEVLQLTMGKWPERIPLKTVMVYWMDQTNMLRVPLGILTERRKAERNNNNAICMLRLAQKVFAKTEDQAKSIVIGDYV